MCSSHMTPSLTGEEVVEPRQYDHRAGGAIFLMPKHDDSPVHLLADDLRHDPLGNAAEVKARSVLFGRLIGYQ